MYKLEDFRSVGWLQMHNGKIKLTPVLHTQSFPISVVISKTEFDTTGTDKTKMLQLVCQHLNRSA